MLTTIAYTAAESPQGAARTIDAAIRGHPVEITREADFVTLFHALDRRPDRDTLVLLRQRSGPGKWTVFAMRRAALSSAN